MRPPVSDRLLRTRRAIVVAKEAQGPDHGLNTLGNLGNVGRKQGGQVYAQDIGVASRRNGSRSGGRRAGPVVRC
jgi:hypothetical protein